MARLLTLHATAAAAAQALARAPGGAFLAGDGARGFLAFAAELAQRREPFRLATSAERLLLALVAADQAELGLPVAAAGAFARTLSELHGSGLSPVELRQLGPRGAGLSRALVAHRALLARASRWDPSAVARVAAAAVADRGLGGLGQTFDAVRIEPRANWTQAELDLVAALGRELPVEVRLPEPLGRPGLAAPLNAVHQELSHAPGVALSGADVDPTMSPALAQRLAALFGDPASGSPGVSRGPLEVSSYGSAADEARGVAAAVRGLLRAGVAPDAIAVTSLGAMPAAVPQALAAALAPDGAAGPGAAVPVAAASTSLRMQLAAQLAIAVLRAAAEGVPREPFCELLESNAFDLKEGRRWARLLREAGSGDHRSGRLLPPLRALLEREQAQARPAPEGLAELEAFAGALAALPERASVAALARALHRLLSKRDALGWVARAPRPWSVSDAAAPTGAPRQLGLFGEGEAETEAPLGFAPPWVEVARAEARLGREDLEALLESFQALGSGLTLDLAAFASLLEAACEATPARRVGLLPGGLVVDRAEALSGRRFAQVFLVGLTGDGGAAGDDAFLGESFRRAARELTGRPALLSQSGATAGRARERLALWLSAGLADSGLHVSGARLLDGKPQPPSPLLAELARVAGDLCTHPLRPWPLLGVGALTRDQVAAALPLEPAVIAAEPALSARHADLRAQRRARERALLEGRLDAHAGDLTAPDLASALAAALAFGAARPLSASTLGVLASCGFRGLAEALLKVKPPQERDESIDVRDRGTLAHDCLERGFRALAAAGLLPLQGSALQPERQAREAAVFEAAVVEGLLAFETSGPVGHPVLWGPQRKQTLGQLRAVLAAEQARHDSLVPTDFELKFGEGREAPALQLASGPVLLGGRIDRVDRAGSKLRVLDYKNGSLAPRNRKLRREFAERDLQLSHYALTLALAEPGSEIDAAYFSIPEAKYSPSLAEVCAEAGVTLGDFLAVQPAARAAARAAERPNLANRIEDVIGSARAGQFPIRPGDCGYCQLRAACRVGRLYAEWE